MREGRYVAKIDGDYPYEVEVAISWKAGRFSGLVRVGFQCDGGSTGPAGHIGFPSIGDELERGFIVHDWLYRGEGDYPRMKRRHADKIMRKLHKQDGVCWTRRMAAWFAVRRFGRTSWRRHRQYKTQFTEMHR